jgi:CSLREA domain-containing protein
MRELDLGGAMGWQIGFLRGPVLAGMFGVAAALCGCGTLSGPLDIVNETTSLSRTPSNTYTVQAHVTNGATYAQMDVTAIVTGGATNSSTPTTSPDKANFFATVPADQCDQVLSLSYEAKYKKTPSAVQQTAKAPQVGSFKVPISGAPPAACGLASGFSHIFKVNSTIDAVDINPGNGVCSAGVVQGGGGPVCTLRAAVMEANALKGVDYIDVPAGVYLLTIQGAVANAAENNAASGDLDITEGVAIVGVTTNDFLGPAIGEQTRIRPTTIIDGNHANRIFEIHTALANYGTTPDAGWTADKIVDLQQLTLRNGKLPFEHQGGAVYNSGYLHLVRVVFDSNEVNHLNNGSTVSDAMGGALANGGVVDGTELYFLRNVASDGGAMVNFGTATITKSGFFFNSARGGGHAIENLGSNGRMTFENVTFGKNGLYALPPAPPGSSPIGNGPGSFAIVNGGGGGQITLRFVSIFANKGGFWNSDNNGAIYLSSTLAGGNSFMNCAGTIATAGIASMIEPNPQVGYGPCSLATTVFTSPQTVQLAKGISPVFYTPQNAPWRNLVAMGLCPTRDQRNVSRATLSGNDPQLCDSGAVEYEQDSDLDRIAKASVVSY